MTMEQHVKLLLLLSFGACCCSNRAGGIEPAEPGSVTGRPSMGTARGANMNQNDDCFSGVQESLGVPADAVFFLAEKAVEPGTGTSRKWAIHVDGAVRFSSDAGANDGPSSAGALTGDPIAMVPAPELGVFTDWLAAEGFFELPTEVGPPVDMIVSGGVERWIVVRKGVRTHCVHLRPGAPMSDSIKQRFSRWIGTHMR